MEDHGNSGNPEWSDPLSTNPKPHIDIIGIVGHPLKSFIPTIQPRLPPDYKVSISTMVRFLLDSLPNSPESLKGQLVP
jgi:hypothetical protein